MSKIVLASNSPRRKELLEREGIDFIVDASFVEEKLDETLPLEKRLMQLSKDKAYPIHLKYPKDIVIGVDTTVYHNGQIIGKPKDKDYAKAILNELSDDKHVVYSAVSIYNGNQLIQFIDSCDVYFRDISDMIDDYIETGDWTDKAGAYGIQSEGARFVDHIWGDMDTVIGMPVKKVMEVLDDCCIK